MGCDYYILKLLEIHYENTNQCSFITLESEYGYFYYDSSIDEDDVDYEEKIEKCIKEQLNPRMVPIVIYENKNFKTKHVESKYKDMVEEELANSIKQWKDVTKIIKVESRYERE
jgi:hypothetical protein